MTPELLIGAITLFVLSRVVWRIRQRDGFVVEMGALHFLRSTTTARRLH